jgi:EAL domain-containing protein (putative c-di-GMP-specific phosphodiesterase class I)
MTLVSEQLAQHKLRGESLVFEITEQAAIRQLDRACAVIEGLRQLGCRFALDDFGSGFSSLNYVKHLPAAFIKISGMFVQNMMADALDEVMVRSIVQIANAMGMQTVAESVEDRQTLQRIAELGVTYAQGHAIARPSEQLPDAEFFTSYRIPRAGAAPSTRPASSSSLARSLRKR